MFIRERQMRLLHAAMVSNFEEKLVRYVRDVLPRHSREFADDVLRVRIRSCLQKARGYGIASQLALCRFVHVAFLLGLDFDRDPNHEWAGRLLGEDLEDADRTMEYVYEVALEKTSSPGGQA